MNHIATNLADAYATRVARLRDRFLDMLSERLHRADDALVGTSIEEHLNELRFDAHKTAGAAGSFGFDSLTEVSGTASSEIDSYLNGQVSTERLRTALEEYRTELEDVILAELIRA